MKALNYLTLLSLLTTTFLFTSCSKDEINEEQELESTTEAMLSTSSVELSYDSVYATTSHSNYPVEYAFDNNSSTRWSGYGTSASIIMDLGTAKKVDYVTIAFRGGNTRQYSFSYWVGDDGSSWNWVNSKKSSGTTTSAQTFDLSNKTKRYIRFKFQGNSISDWNNVTELKVYGTESTTSSSSSSTTTTSTTTSSGVNFNDLIVETSWISGDKSDRDSFLAADVDGQSWMDKYSSGIVMMKCLAADGHRTELKEEEGDEASLYTYKLMDYTAKLTSIPAHGVTVAQVHNRGGVNRPLLRVYVDDDRYIKVKETNTNPAGSSSSYSTYTGPKYTSGDEFSVSIRTQNGNAYVTVTTNGTTWSQTVTPNSAWNNYSDDYYLKAGVYTEGDDKQPQLKISSFSIDH